MAGAVAGKGDDAADEPADAEGPDDLPLPEEAVEEVGERHAEEQERGE